MDGNAKSDLEHSTEKAVRVSTKSSIVLSKLFKNLAKWSGKFYQKHFSCLYESISLYFHT